MVDKTASAVSDLTALYRLYEERISVIPAGQNDIIERLVTLIYLRCGKAETP
jgi:hypothetical protein